MAKLLVRYESKPDPKATKKWDVIDVRDDDVEWGTREGFPTYLRVSLPGVTKKQAAFLMHAELDPNGRLDTDTGEPIEILHARAWKIVESRINPQILADIDAAWAVSGEYVVPDAQGMLNWLEKKIDGSGRSSW